MTYYTYYYSISDDKNKKLIKVQYNYYNLNEVMVGAINASWGRLFHMETVLGIKDD